MKKADNVINYFLVFILIALAYSARAQQPFAVVELFTSEGCSSCPPADNVLSEIKKEAEAKGTRVFTLAYHVDYWNRLGWKDPFGKFQFTWRQENYSRVLPGGSVYTPQVIVNGRTECLGSNKNQLTKNIKAALDRPAMFRFTLHADSLKRDSLFISYSIPAATADHVLRLALTEDGLSSTVKAGENNGRTLHHDAVVRNLFSVDKPGKTGQFSIPLSAITNIQKSALVAFVQKKGGMEILAVQGFGLSTYK